MVYLLLAAALFEECGYLTVWSKLTSALRGLPIPKITATGLWHARARARLGKGANRTPRPSASPPVNHPTGTRYVIVASSV
ncbi:transposase domain-containing protein [Streptomyces sp. BK79]|uniref:transposase domain-containing protein n=1 Tax=Streptomyces sp. BK79 TaxID=3350097 RepID=UPI00377044BB